MAMLVLLVVETKLDAAMEVVAWAQINFQEWTEWPIYLQVRVQLHLVYRVQTQPI